jgi:RNA recognition motif-containing protein
MTNIDETNQTKNSPNVKENQLSEKEQQLQAQKERTLFCINIDQRCTEDIIFELFLQAGPIENIVRKPDRNGNLIALITYKHLVSCDYAIKLFNGISLFNQPLKVQFSQNSLTSRGSMSNLNTPIVRENAINNYINLNNKSNGDNGYLQTPISNSSNRNRMRQQIDMNNSQSMPTLGAQNGIMNLMLQQFSQNMLPTQLFTSPQLPQPLMMGNQTFNRSKSGSNLQEFNDGPSDSHQSRRANHNERQNLNRAQSYHHSRNHLNQESSQRHDSYNRSQPQQQHHHHHHHQHRHNQNHQMDQSHSRERNRGRRSRSRSRL